jgi:hypothetical protein
MKANRVIGCLAIGLVIAIIGYWVLSSLAAAHKYSGPGIHGNLMTLEIAKARWIDTHKGGKEWPTMNEVLPYLTNGPSKFGYVKPVRGEIYIINKVGERVYAYDPKSEILYSVSAEDFSRIEELKE